MVGATEQSVLVAEGYASAPRLFAPDRPAVKTSVG